MKKFSHIFWGIFIYLTFLSCANNENNPEKIYHEKATEIIRQSIKESSCDCLLEISNESIVEISKSDNPSFDITSDLLKKLKLKNKSSLDSLINLSNNFKFDYESLKKDNIKVITADNIMNVRLKNDNSLLKKCPKGIVFIIKPIFNKMFTKAALDYGLVFSCARSPVQLLEFNNGKWEYIEN